MRTRLKFLDTPVLLEYIQQCLSLYDENTGNITGISNFLMHDWYSYAIIIKIQNFPRNLNFNQKLMLVKKSLAILNSEESEISIDNFNRILTRECENFISLPQKRYFLIIPVKIIKKSIKKRKFSLFHSTVEIKSFSSIKERFDLTSRNFSEEIRLETDLRDYLSDDYTFFSIECFGNSEYDSKQKGELIFEHLRASINFIEKYQSFSLFSSGPPKPDSFIIPAKYLLIFNDSGEFIRYAKSSFGHQEKEIDFRSSENNGKRLLDQTQNLLTKIDSISDRKLKSLIILTLDLHNSSLDNFDKPWLSCFHLWQIIELIALGNKNTSYDTICKRITLLLNEEVPFLDILRLFKEKRNKFVHHADFQNFSNTDIRVIRGMIQFSIMKMTKYKKYNDLARIYNPT